MSTNRLERSTTGIIAVQNPATGETVGETPKAGVEETRTAIRAAVDAFPAWAATPPRKRADILMAGAAAMRAQTEEIALLLTAEQGKPLRDSRMEVDHSSAALDMFAGLVVSGALRGSTVELPRPISGMVVRRPIGVVGAISAWNFPLALLTAKLGPALVAGNTVVAKPAETTPLATLRVAELLQEAGLPQDVLRVVVGTGPVCGEELVVNPAVRKIAFTGSTATGRRIMSAAARELKRVTLELGGSDAAIVCDDADVDLAAKAISVGRFFNAGQACLAVKRVFAFESVIDELIEKVSARAERLRVGLPTEPGVMMGPLHSAAGLSKLEAQLTDARDRGATVVAGGGRLDGPEHANGHFFKPTVLTGVPPDARVWSEETFGPLLPIAPVGDLDEAIQRANATVYGLGSTVFTRSLENAYAVVDRVAAGYTWINSVNITFDELPLGGIKHSGFGKEYGVESIDGFTDLKSVVTST